MFANTQVTDTTTRFRLRLSAVALAGVWLLAAAGCSGDSGPAATISTIDATPSSAAVSATTTEQTAGDDTVAPLTVPATTITETTAPATTALVPVGDGTDIFLLPEGLCFVSGTQGEQVVLPVDCSEPHEGQKYADVPLEIDGAYSDSAAKAAADPVCRSEFELFVGTDYDISELFYVGLTPTEEDWETGYGAVCIVVAENGLLDFDAAGSNL